MDLELTGQLDRTPEGNPGPSSASWYRSPRTRMFSVLAVACKRPGSMIPSFESSLVARRRRSSTFRAMRRGGLRTGVEADVDHGVPAELHFRAARDQRRIERPGHSVITESRSHIARTLRNCRAQQSETKAPSHGPAPHVRVLTDRLPALVARRIVVARPARDHHRHPRRQKARLRLLGLHASLTIHFEGSLAGALRRLQVSLRPELQRLLSGLLRLGGNGSGGLQSGDFRRQFDFPEIE